MERNCGPFSAIGEKRNENNSERLSADEYWLKTPSALSGWTLVIVFRGNEERK